MYNVLGAREMIVEHSRAEQSRRVKNQTKTMHIEALNNGEHFEQNTKSKKKETKKMKNRKQKRSIRSFVCSHPKLQLLNNCRRWGDARRLVRKCYCNCFVINIICWMKLVVCIGVFKIFGVRPLSCGCAIFGIEDDAAVVRPPIFFPIL